MKVATYSALMRVEGGKTAPDGVFASLVGAMVQKIADDGLILCETKHDHVTGTTIYRVRLDAARPREDD